MLAINVWKDTELTRTVLVRPDGKISLPLVGELEVSGLTVAKVQRLLAQRLKEYIDNPQNHRNRTRSQEPDVHHCWKSRKTGIVPVGEAHNSPGCHRHGRRLPGFR